MHNFTNYFIKLAYLYKVTEKKRLIYMHLLLYYVALIPGPQEIDSFRICSSVYIISKKKRLVYMHIVIFILLYSSVLWLTRPSMILPGGSGSWISHMGNERACALHPQE